MMRIMPAMMGRALRGLRSGPDDLVRADPAFAAAPDVIELSSPAFGPGGAIPVAQSGDGGGRSPPLEWIGVPPEAVSLALLVEDQDSPTPRPLVHAILAGMEPRDGSLPAGALSGDGTAGGTIGRNSFGKRVWLPPDPPPGHGAHHYVFQLFALDRAIGAGQVGGRRALVGLLKGHVLAIGTLIGTYRRD